MRQETQANPFGMDEDCRNCPALCATRTQVVHGYGDVAADFLFVGERSGPVADEVGVPFADEEGGTSLQRMLQRLGLADATADSERPTLANAYLTYLTRCRNPDRPPTDEEVDNCEPYLDAEVRTINPELIVPVGARALAAVAAEYTTEPAANLDVEECHGRTIRGRGFELVPMIEPREQTAEQTQSWLEAFADVLASDYRQTKGRRRR